MFGCLGGSFDGFSKPPVCLDADLVCSVEGLLSGLWAHLDCQGNLGSSSSDFVIAVCSPRFEIAETIKPMSDLHVISNFSKKLNPQQHQLLFCVELKTL